MTFTITLQLWATLPIVLTVLLLAGGLWFDRFAIDSILDFQCTLFAIFLCLVCWALILYGRYESWLIWPVLVTAIVIWQAWREKLKRESRQIVGGILVAVWLLVIYGRLTT